MTGSRRTGAGFPLLLASPLTWAAHFLACYLTAAIWCARIGAGPGARPGTGVVATAEAGAVGAVGAMADGVGWVPAALAAYTLAALAVIAAVALRGLRERARAGTDVVGEGDSLEGRRRFVGVAALLLSGLSAVAVVGVGGAAVFFETCR
jgi:hypothetical protein